MIVRVLALVFLPLPAFAQNAPLRIEITEGVRQRMPVAVPPLFDNGAAGTLGSDIAQVVAADLASTGLFRLVTATGELTDAAPAPDAVPREADAATDQPTKTPAAGAETSLALPTLPEGTSFATPVDFELWRQAGIETLVSGSVQADAGVVSVKFRLFDVVAGQPLGDGMQFVVPQDGWRRTAHKIADQTYHRITGDAPYFDSRIAFVGETGPREARQLRVGIMDYDGANQRWLTDGNSLAMAPSFSPDGKRLLFTSYAGGVPQIMLLDVASGGMQPLPSDPRSMDFGARFAPDGRRIVLSRETGGNTDIYLIAPDAAAPQRLTTGPAIDTAPMFSPDGQRILFESDRSGTSQIYVLSPADGTTERISFGPGHYHDPAWSPDGSLIAFSRQIAGDSQIGVMQADGSNERSLTESHLDEGPTWAPNGRVILFARQSKDGSDASRLHMVEISGANLRPVAIDMAASDPDWGAVLP